MSAPYKADSEVYDLMKEIVANYHPDLVLVVDEIAIVHREKASKSGGRVVLGKASKASPLFGVLGDTDYKFILTIAADEWLNLTSRQRKALMDSMLCACRVEEDDDGNPVCSIAVPDVSYFYDELDRWGDWRPRPPEDPESPLERIFGKKMAQDIEEGSDE
jgi:hypothetical protein